MRLRLKRNEQIKIPYKKKLLPTNLILGVILLISGIFQTYFNEAIKWYDFSWFLVSGIYFLLYFIQKKDSYLTIENGFIKKNNPFTKRINIKEIKRVSYITENYILKTKKNDFIINTELIEEESLDELISVLKKMDVEWN